jgi:hypothetical protein
MTAPSLLPLASIAFGTALRLSEQPRSLQIICAGAARSLWWRACLGFAFAVAVMAVERIATMKIVEYLSNETSKR